MKRISFSQYDAVHIYEYLRFYWKKDELGKFGSCPQCEQIGKRLENFIGKKEIKKTEKLLKI